MFTEQHPHRRCRNSSLERRRASVREAMEAMEHALPPGLNVNPEQLHVNWLGFTESSYKHATAKARNEGGDSATVWFALKLLDMASNPQEIARVYDYAENVIHGSALISVRDAVVSCFLAFSGRDRAALIALLECVWPEIDLSRRSLLLMTAQKTMSTVGVSPWKSKRAKKWGRREL